jgi:predicted aspartyl protease
MGLTKLHAKLTNIHEPEKSAEGNFMVDTGASYTVLPQSMARRL